MSAYAPILEDLAAIADELAEVGDDALLSIKAGARHSATDSEMIQDVYESAREIAELAVALGAQGEEEDEEADEEAPPSSPSDIKAAAADPLRYAQHECGDIIQAAQAIATLAQLAGSELSEDHAEEGTLPKVTAAMRNLLEYVGRELDAIEGGTKMVESNDQLGGYLVKAQQTFGGKDREDLKDSDFAGPDRTFPIMTQADVADAARLIGKAKDPEAVKKRIIQIAKRKGFDIPDAWQGATKSMELSAVKMLDDDTVSGPGVMFGSPEQHDLSPMRDFFTKSTDFWIDAWDRRPMIWHHALSQAEILDEMKEAGAGIDELKAMREALDYLEDNPVVGVWNKATIDPMGVWLQGQISKAHKYRSAVKRMIDMGLIKISTDSAPHLVRRSPRLPNGTHEVKRWPIIAASLTPSAAEPRLFDVQAVKGWYEAAGLDMPDAITEDAAKAIEMELIAIDMELLAIANMAG